MANGIDSLHQQRWIALLPGLFALALLSTEATALSLGEPNVHSSLNQPFNAAIPVTLETGESLTNMHISGKLLADPAGNSETNGPALHLTLERRSNSVFIVHISSDNAIQATHVRLKLTLNSEQAQTSREYSILIDPPHELTDTAALAAERKVSTENTQFGPVAASETLWSIAEKINPYPDISQAQMALALYRANPQAFYQPSINALKSGEFLSIPAHDEIAHIPPEQAKREVKAELAQYREARNLPQSRAEAAEQQAAAAATATADVSPTPVNNTQSDAPPLEPAAEALAPTPVVEANSQEQSTPQTIESNPAPSVEELPALSPVSQMSSPAGESAEKTAHDVARLPEKISAPAENTTTPNWIWIISATAFVVLLAVAIRRYLEQRRRNIAEENERRARQAEVTRSLLKEKMLADIQYPQKPAGIAPAPAAETLPQRTKLPDAQTEAAPPQQTAAQALSSELSLLPLEETPTKIIPDTSAPPVATQSPVSYDSLTTAQEGNISAVISDLTDMDENETKLDLALTYAAMGDNKSAANLLANVIANGSDAQQTEARKHLEKLNKEG